MVGEQSQDEVKEGKRLLIHDGLVASRDQVTNLGLVGLSPEEKEPKPRLTGKLVGVLQERDLLGNAREPGFKVLHDQVLRLLLRDKLHQIVEVGFREPLVQTTEIHFL